MRIAVGLEDKTMLLPQSTIYALGLPCVLSSVNSEQRIGDSEYFYKDLHHVFYVDDWWGKLALAREIIYFNRDIKLKTDFSNYMN